MSVISALLSPPLLSHDIEGSPLPEEDWLAFPERKSSQLEPPSVCPDEEFAEGLETGDISQQKKRYVNVKYMGTDQKVVVGSKAAGQTLCSSCGLASRGRNLDPVTDGCVHRHLRRQ